MELVVLRRLVGELADRIVGQRVDQIYALPRRDLALVLGERGAPRLWFSADPDDPHVYLRPSGHPTPRRPPAFAMAGRKWMRGQRIRRLALVQDDRIVELETTGAGARLVFELLPRRACAFVVDPDGRVAAVWSPKKGRPRPGEEYIPPDRRPRTPVDQVDASTWRRLEGLESDRELVSSLLRSIAGMTRLVAREIAARRHRDPLFELARAELDRGHRAPSEPRVYAPAPLDELRVLPHPSRFLLAPYPLAQAEELTATSFPDLMDAAEGFYLHRARLEVIEATRRAVASAAADRLDRLERARRRIREQRPEPGEADRLRRLGDTLLATPDAEIEEGRARAPDIYGDGEIIEIPVDSSRTPVENAQRYYRKAQRAERRLKHGRARLKRLEAEGEELEALREEAARIITIEERDELIGRALELGLEIDRAQLREPEAETDRRVEEADDSGPEPSRPTLPTGVRGFRTRDGHDILVGRSAKGNDRLTHEVAGRQDWWLHARGPGSHVVLTNPTRAGSPPADVLLTAARLAAWYSRAKEATKVEVHWTRVRNVKRPKGGRAGAALMDEHETLLVEPAEPGELDVEAY